MVRFFATAAACLLSSLPAAAQVGGFSGAPANRSAAGWTNPVSVDSGTGTSCANNASSTYTGSCVFYIDPDLGNDVTCQAQPAPVVATPTLPCKSAGGTVGIARTFTQTADHRSTGTHSDWIVFKKGGVWTNDALGNLNNIANGPNCANPFVISTFPAVTPTQVVTSAASNGSGLIRLTVGSTAAWHTGNVVRVSGVAGTTEANGQWLVTVVDGTHLDLATTIQGAASVFSNAYTSGGSVFSDRALIKHGVNSIRNLGAIQAAGSGGTTGTYGPVPLVDSTTGSTSATVMVVVNGDGTVHAGGITLVNRGYNYIQGGNATIAAGGIGGTVGVIARVNITNDSALSFNHGQGAGGDNLYIGNIEQYDYRRDPFNVAYDVTALVGVFPTAVVLPGYAGWAHSNPTTCLTVENVSVHHFPGDMSFQGGNLNITVPGPYGYGISFRRNVLHHGSAQCLFQQGIGGTLIEENFFDTCGWFPELAAAPVTISNASPAVVTYTQGANFMPPAGTVSAGGTLQLTVAGGSLPTGLSTNTNYHLCNVSGNTANLSTTQLAGSITGAANNGSGLIRITVGDTTGLTGNTMGIAGVVGTTEANGTWAITVIDAMHADLVGSAFANAYVSGGQYAASCGILINTSSAGSGTFAAGWNFWGKSVFNHCVYLNETGYAHNFFRNISANCSETGVQFRPGGLISNNLFFANSVGMNVGGHASVVTNNVCLEFAQFSDGDCIDLNGMYPVDINTGVNNTLTGSIITASGNIAANSTAGAAGGIRLFAYNATVAPSNGYQVNGNIIYQWAGTTILNEQGSILTTGALVGGSGGTDGVYTTVALTGGSGTAVKANIQISDGAVVSVVVNGIPTTGNATRIGQGCNVGATLVPAPGHLSAGGTGFLLTVTQVSLNNGGIIGYTWTPGSGYTATQADFSTLQSVTGTCNDAGGPAQANLSVPFTGSGVQTVEINPVDGGGSTAFSGGVNTGINYVNADSLTSAISGMPSGWSIAVGTVTANTVSGNTTCTTSVLANCTPANPSFPNPQNAKIENYDTAILTGPGTQAHFFTCMEAQSRDNWNSLCTAAVTNNWMRDRFGQAHVN